MWTISDLKQRAKNILNATYWNSFIMCLVLTVCSGGISSVTSLGSGSSEDFADSLSQLSDVSMLIPFLAAIAAIFFGVYLFSLAFRIFVCNPIALSTNKFFIQAAYGDSRLDYIAHGFKKNYKNCIKIMFLKDLFVWLWSLLFIIPGIVKSYEYFFVPYILAENPDIEYERAFEISKAVTNGNKMNMFILDLSFIGWYLLGMLLCGIGVLFVNPYAAATKTQLYLRLKGDALARGIATDSDFAHYITY